jgi:alpha-L-fucosidase
MRLLKTILLAGSLLASPVFAQTAPATDYPFDFKKAPVAKELAKVDKGIKTGPYKPEWDSLQDFRVPDWFRDAKFGIFIHWGVYSVPAYANEWYPRNMYVKGSAAYIYHKNVFGPQSKFGYKDFIPQFKAEKFDADQWIQLFQDAGARYVVPVAEHCDGFAMYDSDMTDWDVVKMGPKRDTLGELAKATRAHGLHFGLSSHRAEHWWWYEAGRAYDSDISDPKYAGLYGPAAPRTLPADDPNAEPNPSHLENWFPPSKDFRDDWLARSAELVDKYQPELVYLDWWTSAPALEPELRKFSAYYYNEAKKRGQGPAIAYKGENFADGSALFDVERGKLDTLRLVPWETDTSVSIGSWGYAQDDKYRTAKSLTQTLIDVVSKNGNLLLNVGPKADGTIPEEAATVLRGMGAWLKVNGEAIYGTRPFKYFGEGPTTNATGEKRENPNQGFSSADIRFTTKGDMLYAIGLERPRDGKALIKTFYTGTPYLDRPIQKIELVGSTAAIDWQQTPKGLVVNLPASSDSMPYVLKITR